MTKIILMFCFFSISAFSQLKIAVLPFSNLDGNADFNKYCYELQDSLADAFVALDAEQKFINVVPVADVISILDEMNISANNPNFDGDKWQVLEKLNCDRIVSGTFRIVGKRFLINSYIYYPDTQLQEQEFQAKDIFKKEDKVMEAVPSIIKQLSKAFIN